MLVTLYPSAAEATVCEVFPRPPVDPDIPKPADVEVDRAAHRERAARRARSRVRRYCVANELCRMWVLTVAGDGWHGAEGRSLIQVETAKLMRKLRAKYGDFAYVYSPELHPGGHGWHQNVLVAGWIPHREMQRLWPHGNTWVEDFQQHSHVKGGSAVELARAAAKYASKYAAKDWGQENMTPGAHRYELAEGFEPVPVLAEVRSVEEGVALAVAYLGSAQHVWWSADDDAWDGPGCAVVFAHATTERPGPSTG